MRTRITVLTALALIGCSADDDGGDDESNEDAAGDTESDDGTGGGSAGSESGDAGSGDTGEGAGECGLPEGIAIFCESFDEVEDLSERFTWHHDPRERYRLADVQGRDETTALQVEFDGQDDYAGQSRLAFGIGPDATGPAYATEGPVNEVWVRFYMRLQEDWPPGQIGTVARLSVVTQGNDPATTPHVASILLSQTTAAQGLNLDVVTCMVGGEHACADLAYDDVGPVEFIGFVEGTSPVVASEVAGQWQCIEMHAFLGGDGNAGFAEYWIDGEMQGRADGLDMLRDWGGNETFNMFSLRGLFSEKPMEIPVLRRWIDDLVIAQGPIGC